MPRFMPLFIGVLAVLFGFSPSHAGCVEDAAPATDQFPPRAVDHCYGPDGWNYNRNLAARAYALYAAASNDAYRDFDKNDKRAFSIADDLRPLNSRYSKGSTGWLHLERRSDSSSGFAYDVYVNPTTRPKGVLIAYRGTDGFFDVDSFANASWFIGAFNPMDQYTLVREEFPAVIERAKAKLRSSTIGIVTTGHSLGGGLARHVAGYHPDVTAVTFNSSPVTRTLFAPRSPISDIRVYENNDGFSRLNSAVRRLHLMPSTNTPEDAVYRLNVSEQVDGHYGGIKIEHSAERLAAGLLRSSILCKKDKDRECKTEDTLSKTIYCRYMMNRTSSQLVDDEVTCN